MLELAKRGNDRLTSFAPSGSLSHPELSEIERLTAAARRQLNVVIAACLVAVLLAAGYNLTAVPRFTAEVAILLDNRRLVKAVEDTYDVNNPAVQGLESQAAVDSQVELLTSDKIALAVIDKLQLERDPEFTQPRPSLFGLLFAHLPNVGGTGDVEDLVIDDAESVRRTVLERVKANTEVRRVQRTFVLEIQYTSYDPAKAARIANAFAAAYLVDQLEARYEATQRASSWLSDRLAQLKQQVLTSDLAVERFKQQNNLISAGGRLINEQQLGEVNSQLVLATADVARAEARYGRIKAIVEGHQTDALVTEAIGNQIIEQLRSRYLVAVKRESELSVKLGPDHNAVESLRAEMREFEKLMFEELGRIAESYRSDLDIARSRERSLRESMSGLVDAHGTASETSVALRELEREAESYRTLYQSFLVRHQAALQQQSLPLPESRIITAGLSPTVPSHPKKMIIIALSVLLGAAVGVGLGAIREFRERAFRTEEQVYEELGLECLGTLPSVKPPARRTSWLKLKAEPKPDGPSEKASKSALHIPPGVARYVLDHPLSGFAETLRAVKVAADLTLPGRVPKVIGIVSVLPAEGKSTIAMNLGSLLAHMGIRTLLIDGDLRNPGLTRRTAPTADAGLVQAVLEGKPINELVLCEQEFKLAFLPAVVERRVPHSSEFLGSPGMSAVLKQAAQSYDCVVLDLPPLGPVVDVRAITSEVDAFLLVVEWGITARRLVRTTLAREQNLRDKCLGVVLNKVNVSGLKRYEAHGSKSYYSARYSNYYQDIG